MATADEPLETDERALRAELEAARARIVALEADQRPLRLDRAKLAELVENSAYGYVEGDLAGRLTFLNRRGAEIIGYGEQEALGLGFEDIVVPDELPRAAADLQLVFTEPNAGPRSYRIRTKSGEVRHVEINTLPIRDGGVPLGFQATFLDVSQRARLERELRRRERLEALGVLAGGIAHEFNNVLTAILGGICLASRRIGRDHAAAGILEGARRASLEATELARHLLTFAKGGAPLAAETAAEEVIGLAVADGPQGPTCALDVPDGLWRVYVDAGQVGHALALVVRNAWEAEPRGKGDVHVTIRACNVDVRRSDAPLRIGRYVAVTVCDDGAGVPEAARERLFDPFFTTKPGHSGLGLAIAHSVLRRHGGHIELAPAVSEGTAVTLYLPVAREAGRLQRHSPRGARRRVLVMDDDAGVREIAADMLETLGYEVVCTEHGADAIAEFKQALLAMRPFDLLILDASVPGGLGAMATMDGIRRLAPDARAIVSTGYTVAAAGDAGGGTFAACLPKPYTLEELAEVVRSVLH